MTQANRKNIRRSLSFLATKTVNVEQLLEALYHKQLIDEGEKDRIHGLSPKTKKFSEMYMLLVRKGLSDSFELLHDALVETENDGVAELLKLGHDSNNGGTATTVTKQRFLLHRTASQIEVDIPVQETHIDRIVSILEATIAHAEWPLIVRDMLEIDAITELERLPSTTPYEILFAKTLQLWVASRGNAATFNTFLRILDARKQHETAESLKSNCMKIFAP
ncbi:unnamed protein product [Allacma fusca]|uniref:CARD domain-containing protein n=1 Tax=Allacma fusca TaxID=39272 RepID=A0A8J2NQE7_9HEXA|nr:unnamed protein product [Allacma fusca]